MAIKFQTLGQFLSQPFGRKNSIEKLSKYNLLYKDYRDANKIYVEGYCKVEDSYFIHIRVPSETNKEGKLEYDVVIRFFAPNILTRSERTLVNYHVQFFSNSPGFMYHYAVLYKKEGFLIESLYNKLDPDFFDTLPNKTNPNMEMSFDKTIFFACKYLSEHNFSCLNKLGILAKKLKKPDRFFEDISDFKSVKVTTELISVEKKMNQALGVDQKKERDDPHRKGTVKSTTKPSEGDTPKRGITIKTKITGKSKVSKKTAGKTTRRK